jgi:hypothetical protein
MPISPELISADELVPPEIVAAELLIKRETLTTWRHRGFGPAFLKVGRRVFYRRDDLAQWLASQRRHPATVEARRAEAAA